MSASGLVRKAVQVLRSGGIAAFPTETVYCLGADVKNRDAVARLFEIKKRPRFDPLIIHVADTTQLPELITSVPDKAQRLIEHFWPGALTVVLPRKHLYHDVVTAGMTGVAIRLPSDPVALELLSQVGTPVAVASANCFGNVSPTTAQHVRDDLGETIEVVDGGPCRIGIETTIVSFVDGEPVKLRPGAIPLEETEKVIEAVRRSLPPSSASFFPGMSDHHYTRRSVMLYEDDLAQLPSNLDIGLISFKGSPDPSAFAAVEVLSPSGDLDEAAHNLFAVLRRMDARDLDLIVAQRVPNTGIGIAINDRLSRACF